MTLKVRNLGSAVQSGLAVSIIIPLPLDFVYQHLPDSRLVASTPLNHMQALFPRWYNPDEMWISLWVSSASSIQQLQEFQELRPNDGEQEASWVCERWCHWPYCHKNILRLTKDWKCLAKHKYCQKSWSKNGAELSIISLWIVAIVHFVLGSHLILERNMSFLCLSVVLKSRDASFKMYVDKIFWSNSNMQN